MRRLGLIGFSMLLLASCVSIDEYEAANLARQKAESARYAAVAQRQLLENDLENLKANYKLLQSQYDSLLSTDRGKLQKEIDSLNNQIEYLKWKYWLGLSAVNYLLGHGWETVNVLRYVTKTDPNSQRPVRRIVVGSAFEERDYLLGSVGYLYPLPKTLLAKLGPSSMTFIDRSGDEITLWR